MNAIPRITALLLICLVASAKLPAAPEPSAGPASMEYKLLSNLKQPFNDDLQYHLSKGWKPVGGVSVTVWNNDLYFAQLIGKPAKQGQ